MSFSLLLIGVGIVTVIVAVAGILLFVSRSNRD